MKTVKQRQTHIPIKACTGAQQRRGRESFYDFLITIYLFMNIVHENQQNQGSPARTIVPRNFDIGRQDNVWC
jgi:hypothetical protein